MFRFLFPSPIDKYLKIRRKKIEGVRDTDTDS